VKCAEKLYEIRQFEEKASEEAEIVEILINNALASSVSVNHI
jgi:hypothetical protein